MRARSSAQWIVLTMALLAAPFASDAGGKVSFPPEPLTGSATSDAAGLISKEHSSEIDGLAAALFVEKGFPLRVVTIRSLATQGANGYTIERYAAELLKSSKDERMRSYGMLLLVAADDRTARIQLGSEWGQAHDGRAREVMDRMILPAFRRAEFSPGIVAGVRGFDAMARGLALPTGEPWWKLPALTATESDRPWWTLPALAAGAVLLVVGLVSLVRSGRKSWAWAAAAFVLGLFLSRLFGGSAEASDSGGGATGEW